MMLGPVMLTLGVTVDSRTRTETFRFVNASPEEQAKVEAYQEPYQAALKANQEGVVSVRKVAAKWIALRASKQLEPLEPIAYEDTMQEGVKGQINLAIHTMGSILLNSAQKEIKEEKFSQAAQDSMLAANLVRTVKYIDFQGLGSAGILERRSLHVLSEVLAALPQSERAAYVSPLNNLRMPKEALGRMAAKQRNLFMDYQIRMELPANEIQECDRVVSAESAFQRDADIHQAVNSLKEGLLASRDDNVTPLFSVTRLGYMSEVESMKKLDETLAVANSAAKPVKPKVTAPVRPVSANSQFSQMAERERMLRVQYGPRPHRLLLRFQERF